MKKLILSILTLIILLTPESCFAETHSTQIIQASLPEVLHIEKIIVDGVEYEKDEKIENVEIRGVEQISEDCYRLSLNPFSVRINTNIADPIQVSAKFESCCSACGRYPMKPEDLSVSPSSYTINNPYNMIETDFFTPQVLTHPDTVCTTYNARLVISLGRV